MPINVTHGHRPAMSEPEKQSPKSMPRHSAMTLTHNGYALPLTLSENVYFWLDQHENSVKKLQEILEELASQERKIA